MAKRNDGSYSEKEFERIMEQRMKDAPKRLFVHRMTDTKSIKQIAGQKSFAKAAPSDYLVTLDGVMFYAEVKSTSEATSFKFSCFTPSQNLAMVKQVAAGGEYNVYVHHLPTDTWYEIPAYNIVVWKQNGFKSIKWDELEVFKWMF